MSMHSRGIAPAPIELKDGDDDPSAVVTKALGDLSKTVDDRFKAIEEKTGDLAKIAARLDDVETRLARPGIVGKGSDDKAPTVEQKAFTSFVRGGAERLGAEELKSMRVSTETQGGYLAPDQFIAELDRNLVLISPIRSAARVSATMAGAVKLPKRTAGMTASWVGETETRPSTEPAYGSTDLVVHEAACYVDVSNALLEDAGVDIASELAFDFAEEFGRIEGAAFVGGDGVKKPLGLLNTAGISTVNTGAAADFAASNPGDNLIDLFYSLPSAYAANAVWGMNRTVMGKVRKFKDGQGQYLWQPGLQPGQPATILGRPVVEMPDMPNVGAGNYPVVIGDFRHFRIFDRIALSVLRDPFSVATSGLVRFHGRRRVAGGVTKTEAFKFLKCST